MKAQVNIEKALTELSSRESEFETACLGEADAEHGYKIKQAKEFMAAEGTEKARTATSLVKCEREHLEYLRAKAVKEFTREKLRDCQDALSARQSLLSFEIKTNFGYAQNQT